MRGRLTYSSGSIYMKQCAAVSIQFSSIRAPPQIKVSFPEHKRTLDAFIIGQRKAVRNIMMRA